jgi:hypothetical protein
MLQDRRHAHCVDGLLMMLNCLPTAYTGYAKWLPTWVTLWAAQPNNPQWDMCWLTLLCRARKHTDVTAFDWGALLPVLTLKARELLALPGARGKGFSLGDFPFAFPVYYQKLMTAHSDARFIALNKIAKLLYFAAMHEGLVAAAASVGGVAGAPRTVAVEPLTITPPSLTLEGPRDPAADVVFPGFSAGAEVLPGMADLVTFFQVTTSPSLGY